MQNLKQKLRDLKPRLDAAVDNFLAVKKNRIFARVFCCISVVLLLFALASPFILASVQASAAEPSTFSNNINVTDLTGKAFIVDLELSPLLDVTFMLSGVAISTEDLRIYTEFDRLYVGDTNNSGSNRLALIKDNFPKRVIDSGQSWVFFFTGGSDVSDAAALAFWKSQPSFELLFDDIPSSLIGNWEFYDNSIFSSWCELSLIGAAYFEYLDGNTVYLEFDSIALGYDLAIVDGDYSIQPRADYFSLHTNGYWNYSSRAFDSYEKLVMSITGGDVVTDPYWRFIFSLGGTYTGNLTESLYVPRGWYYLSYLEPSAKHLGVLNFSSDFFAPFLSDCFCLSSVVFEHDNFVFSFEDSSTYNLLSSDEYMKSCRFVWSAGNYLDPDSKELFDYYFDPFIDSNLGADYYDGYDVGFNAGYGEGLSGSFMSDFITGVLDGLDSLTIVFGYSFLTILSSIIGIFVTLWLVRLFT